MALWCGQNARPFVTVIALVYQPPRRPALPALAVLALHLGVGGVLIQQRSLPELPPARVELRLIELPRPPRAVEPPAPRPAAPSPRRLAAPETATLPVPEVTLAAPGPNAITLPAAPVAPVAPAPAASARPALNLALPKDWKPEARNTPAQQAIHDPRANSPRRTAEQELARRIANEAETIELADGSKMTRRPDGSCTSTRSSRADALFPMDAPVGGGHQGNCFNDKPGSAIQHARPR